MPMTHEAVWERIGLLVVEMSSVASPAADDDDGWAERPDAGHIETTSGFPQEWPEELKNSKFE